MIYFMGLIRLMWVFYFIYPIFSGAQVKDLTLVPIGKASLMKDKIFFVVAPFRKKSQNVFEDNILKKFIVTIFDDFSFYRKRFEIVRKERNENHLKNLYNYSYWKNQEVTYLINIDHKLIVEIPKNKKMKKSKKIFYSMEVLDINNKVSIYKSEGTLSRVNLRKKGHTVSDESYFAITGQRSIFRSKILFISDRIRQGKKTFKELHLMDFDGHNKVRLTYNKGTVVGPSISFDGTKAIYSLIKDKVTKKRNVNLYLLDIKTKKSTMISSRPGLNTGAVFLPDGKHIALTLTKTGNAEIYIMNLLTRKLRRITKNFAIDVAPSFNRDASMMAFLSSRSGKPMIYTLDPSGTEKKVTRVSYIGDFNANPRFSPDGKEIAFSSWIDNSFDIFRINSDLSGLVRLTKNFGSNESPTYSNDGNFIAFSSQRVLSRKKAVWNIYIMDKDGEIIKKITENYGNCITPRWSKSLIYERPVKKINI